MVARQARPLIFTGIAVLVLLASCRAPLPAPVSERSPIVQDASGSYLVRPGDTLYSIAFRFAVDFNALARWNRLSAPYRLQPGQRLLTVPPTAGRTPAQAAVIAEEARLGAKVPWRWPVAAAPPAAKAQVVRVFGSESLGLDFRLAAGASVHAAAGGPVVYAGSGLGGYSYLVILRHGTRYLSAYGFNGHLRVAEGQIAKVGERLADIEAIGPRGALLHFEVRDHGAPIDPRLLLP